MRKNQKEHHNTTKYMPIILVILDGWGIAKPNKGNAVNLAKTPFIDSLTKKYPHTELCASGKCVGLPADQPGNSEAGHMNIGAGRLVEQDMIRISRSINNGTFFKNAAFLEAIRHVKKGKGKLHLMGMLSDGMSPHSDPDHILALIILARNYGLQNVYLHLFTDGRDSPRYASLKLIERLERELTGGEFIATVMGRFYAMDRKKKWERTEMAYDALVLGRGGNAATPQDAVTESYNRGESDEFIRPYIMLDRRRSATGNAAILPRIDNNDSVIFFNLRSDRARQLAKPFAQKDFNRRNPGSFKRKKVLKNIRFIALTDFGPDLDNVLTAYPSADLRETLPMRLKNLRQLYIAETEKYAHVTYFFNGGYADPVNGEARMAVPSPDVSHYDQTPDMSSGDLAGAVVNNLKRGKYDFTVLNFAAPDMIGHTGNLKSAVKCCEMIDRRLSMIARGCLRAGGTIIITGDHGNIEKMVNLETDEVITKHSNNPVPFILINEELRGKIKLRRDGILGDIAPTILDLIGAKKPKEMTGKSLIQ